MPRGKILPCEQKNFADIQGSRIAARQHSQTQQMDWSYQCQTPHIRAGFTVTTPLPAAS
jgi:hypothetical protein